MNDFVLMKTLGTGKDAFARVLAQALESDKLLRVIYRYFRPSMAYTTEG